MYSHKIFRLNVREQLPEKEAESRAYIENLSNLLGDSQQSPIFEHLYENLSILDAKSASLLQFNSILLAVFAIFLTAQVSTITFYAAMMGIFASLVSSYLLLDVVWVHWSTADHMHVRDNHELKLLDVRKSRTILYRIAWNFSKFGILAIAVVVILVVGSRTI